MSKRILLVITSLNGGGAEMAVLRMLKAFNAVPDTSAHLISLSQKNDYQDVDPEMVTMLPIANSKSLDSFFKRGKVIQLLQQEVARLEQEQGAFDVIFSHLEVTNVIVAAANFHCPVFYVHHNSIQQELLCAKERGPFKYFKMKQRLKALKNKDVICVSKGSASEFTLPWLPVKSCQVIYNPFDAEEIIAGSQEGGNPYPDRPYLLHVGRFGRAKRHDRLFEAFAQLTGPEVLVLLTKQSSKLTKLIKRYGLEDRVIVAGFQANPYRFMKHARCVVLSSDYEGLGNVMVESLLIGTPFIANDYPHGAKEVLGHWRPEWLAETGSADDLARKLAQLLQQPPQAFQWPDAELFSHVHSANAYLALINKAT
ncbi:MULTISPECIES: glycosyltransferase [Alkalimonas]|uniref:Glycosyltransferase n=1 Tax=Alkalimonas mucilaginosa TaxID=3057676 RepID=A0ABU7JL00_9GAMM|nr:glycosyltransferase [Alkalimonas sp. MEB004]MEE2026028.1 glycosyltransferase [Alkalimonas sp. MEB004]